MSPLSVLLLALCAQVSRGQNQTGAFAFDGDIRRYAVANSSVYVATDDRLYQLDRNLTLVHSVTLRGVLKGVTQTPDEVQFYRVPEASWWNATFMVNVLLPFAEDGTLISCGLTDNDCGHCEVLLLRDITELRLSETIQVGALRHNYASVALLVKVEKKQAEPDTFILTAIQKHWDEPGNVDCVSDSQTVNLQDADQKRKRGIFSLVDDQGTHTIQTRGEVDFVDGFQVGFDIYLLSNVPSGANRNKVRLLWLKGETNKHHTIMSLRGATLLVSDPAGAHKLVASSVVPGTLPVLWGGVFSEDRGTTNTVLTVFDISPDFSSKEDADPDFYYRDEPKDGQPKTLRPEAVIFRQKHMTCVRALRHKTWLLFLIGTRDGQLIKLAVDKNYHTSCPIVLYRADDDRPVFPRIHLDEVDRQHVFVPLRNQMKRVPVSQCGTYEDVRECWSAQDPHCVWCGSNNRCTLEDDCGDSDWLSIPEDYHEKMVSYRVTKEPTGQITLHIQTHVTAGQGALPVFTCHLSASATGPDSPCGPPAQFPQCTCNLTLGELPVEGFAVSVKIQLGSTQLQEPLTLTNCYDLKGPPTPVLCRRCIRAGCGWDTNKCTWANEGVANDSVCQLMLSGMSFSKPEISSVTPGVVSFHGRNHAVLSGRNLSDVTGVRLQGHAGCAPKESPVWNNTGVSLTFHIPSVDRKGEVRVCALLPDGSCHGDGMVTYQSSPTCSGVVPSSSWASGKRKVTLLGSHLDFVEGVTQSHTPQEVQLPENKNYQNLTYDTHAAENVQETFNSTVALKVANRTLPCPLTITYYPEPEFTGFKSFRAGEDVRVTIEKKTDALVMTIEELSVWGVQSGRPYPCVVTDKEIHNDSDTFTCEIRASGHAEIQELTIKYGGGTVVLYAKSWLVFLWVLLVLLLTPCIIVMVVIIYRGKQKKLTAEMNRLMEDLELDIRNDIRQGFIDLQTEKSDLLENVGAIPFLDYKHFASRIFFPESDSLMALCVKDIGQDSVKVQLDECCHSLSELIQDPLFLTSVVHALEGQKSFTIKDKCTVASLLTVALHRDLFYLTTVMKTLLKDLMQQSSNTQPKLLLRRTESIVEKLLTNWMSICLYGFLRESVGQHLFLMVSALTQQIKKGPVDCVTEKALYTLSEDWLLWQAQDFTSVKLKVLFAVGSDGEVSEPLEVDALSCDSVEQVKEKILSTFKAKFGFAYNHPLRDVRIELEREGSFVPLEEVDGSSQVIGQVTMLNTLRHYKVPDGATIKVLPKTTHPPLSPQGSLKDDENFSGKYFHLIDPEVDEDQRKDPERKKLKLKEVHLTKLLSTKVAVHSFVGNLFKSIWGMTHGKAPHAIKYFFGFLDAQADGMKVVDPDVLHIWKTNSLPLRFWINILKNPQFVFDMEKTPQLDGCLSVIAQAFMDSFSLSEAQLGKHTPTNKLLYAKDIPGFKQEVKAYYKLIRDQPPISDSEFKSFLEEESKKHGNEFNESAALREIYKFILKYFTEIIEKLNENGAPTELTEQLHHVKSLFDGLKSCSWS